jgi:hypothetical protein
LSIIATLPVKRTTTGARATEEQGMLSVLAGKLMPLGPVAQSCFDIDFAGLNRICSLKI